MRNILIATTACLAGSMLFSTDAYAGGLGLVSAAGLHSEHVYAYSEDLTQYKVSQLRPTYGVGLQAILGDVDDDFVGVAKMYWIGDAPPQGDGVQQAARDQGAEGDVTYAARQGVRPMGIATAGLQWGVLGDPTGVQLNIVANLGSSFMTQDASEFLLAEVGVGGHYSLTETVQVNAEATYRARYRKEISHGGGLTLGVRYFFD